MMASRLVSTVRFISARRVWPSVSARVISSRVASSCWWCCGRNSAVVTNSGQVRQASVCGHDFCYGRPQYPLGRAIFARDRFCFIQAASASGPSVLASMGSPRMLIF